MPSYPHTQFRLSCCSGRMPHPLSAMMAAGLLCGMLLFSVSGQATEPSTPSNDPFRCGAIQTSQASTNVGIEVQVSPQTAWQPYGGELLIDISSPSGDLSGVQVLTCFDWAYKESGGERNWLAPERPLRQISVSSHGVHLAVVVPDLDSKNHSIWLSGKHLVSSALMMIPQADVRILVNILQKDGKTHIIEEIRSFGVIPRSAPIVVTAILLTILLAVLVKIARSGHDFNGISPFLSIITASNGRASLSQLQIVLWSLVLAASAIYVMVASGQLITFTPQALGLLGVSGATLIGRQLAPPDLPQPKIDNKPGSPLWRDLVKSKSAITDYEEIDVTRLQMLLFTIIGVIFVLLKVVSSYKIPEIDASFLALMGISNGVYVGQKLITRHPPQDHSQSSQQQISVAQK